MRVGDGGGGRDRFAVRKCRFAARESVRDLREEEAFYDAGSGTNVAASASTVAGALRAPGSTHDAAPPNCVAHPGARRRSARPRSLQNTQNPAATTGVSTPAFTVSTS